MRKFDDKALRVLLTGVSNPIFFSDTYIFAIYLPYMLNA
jgi:hypothetical protein